MRQRSRYFSLLGIRIFPESRLRVRLILFSFAPFLMLESWLTLNRNHIASRYIAKTSFYLVRRFSTGYSHKPLKPRPHSNPLLYAMLPFVSMAIRMVSCFASSLALNSSYVIWQPTPNLANPVLPIQSSTLNHISVFAFHFIFLQFSLCNLCRLG